MIRSKPNQCIYKRKFNKQTRTINRYACASNQMEERFQIFLTERGRSGWLAVPCRGISLGWDHSSCIGGRRRSPLCSWWRCASKKPSERLMWGLDLPPYPQCSPLPIFDLSIDRPLLCKKTRIRVWIRAFELNIEKSESWGFGVFLGTFRSSFVWGLRDEWW